ncbi:MAG: beta-Ala-His dipeptidase [Fibromonadaceae bacterium]|jgi:dipeptidase D|nr:beta-Ala-His dipeptidase [Fibromonadaceae bacterium]
MSKISKTLVKETSDRVMELFEDICKIYPRGSKKEKAACDFLKKFVEEQKKKGIILELKHQCEEREEKPINNIVITKPATPGYENAKKLALQAHLDMVCQKISGSTHDFDTMPIITEIKNCKERGKIMTSKNNETTLGADDGIGMACILAVLESENIPHPEIQAIFTSDEEDGMSGARHFDSSFVTADRLINIDAETEGTLYYGCAGGIYANINIPANFVKKPEGTALLKFEISGLKGGHSGIMIHKGRANANRLMGRALNYFIEGFPNIMLADILGGDAKNAITTKAVAVVAVENNLVEKFKSKAKNIEGIFKYEYSSLEEGLKVSVSDCKESYEKVMAKDTLDKTVAILMTVPNGVLDMHTEIEGLVETSSNLGVVALNEASVSLICFVRSSIESKKKFVVEQIRHIAEKVGADFVADTDSPEWNPNPDSQLMKLFQKTYSDIFNKQLACKSVHAGLECGYFFKRFFDEKTQKSIDAVAIGPNIDDVHIPKETLHLDTVEPVVELLLNVMASMD